MQNRKVQVYYAAVTDRRVLMAEVSCYVQRPRGLALSDPRQGASLRPLTGPARSQRMYAAVEYRGPSGQARTLWYSGVFEDEVGRPAADGFGRGWPAFCWRAEGSARRPMVTSGQLSGSRGQAHDRYR